MHLGTGIGEGVMYGSQEANRDLNLNGKEESDVHPPQQQQQMTTGLLRFRSAPTTLLGEMCEDFLSCRSTDTESDALLTRFPSAAVASGQKSPLFSSEIERRAPEAAQKQNGGLSPVAASLALYPGRQQQQPLLGHCEPAATAIDGYRGATSPAMESEEDKSRVNASNLVRHSSSPAGMFSLLNVENGLAVMGGMAGFRLGTYPPGEAAANDGRLRGQLSFSSRQSSSSTLMTQISEIGEEDVEPQEGALGNGGRRFVPGFPVASWDDPSLFSDTFSGMKRPRDPPEAQIGDVRSHGQSLSHQYGLPKTSSEVAAILQFQDAVPCKIRAKRGCATHPRSIAERVRRTRISERMRKLQELVPNMDKQTNTADMLNLAVEYIKDLEKQVKSLSEIRANCTCSSGQKL